MERTLFRVAAVIATAVLAIASAEARAQTVDPTADPGITGAEQAQPADVQPASPAPVTAPDSAPQPDAATQAPYSPSDAGAQPGGATTGGPDPQTASQSTAGGATGSSAPTESSPTAPAGPDTTASPTASDAGATNPPADPGAGSTTALPESETIALSEFTTSAAGDTPPPQGPQEGPATSVPAPALLDPIGPAAGEARPSLDGREDPLPELLPRVERELRSVQVQIEQVQRHLADGTPPPPSGLVQLRRSLEWIAPALLALEVRLDAAGRLTPRLRELLRRVRTRLSGTRASAAGLITALRRSGLRGPELRLLLRELESFGALDVSLVWSPPALPPPTPANAGPSVTYTQMAPAPAASQHYAAAAPEPRAGRPAPAAPSDGGGPDEPPPWSSVPGSATAGPGGAFFVAGLASLAALLIRFALPLLWSRLEAPRRRRYAVVFLAPLERPG